jgi:hypothetical protein
MRYLRSAVLLTFLATSAACSWRSTPVPVIADQGSVAALVGDWTGEYSSSETGRSGSITFQLASESDTAYGDVLMVPGAQAVQPAMQERDATSTAASRGTAEPLKIRFVRMENGRVSGTLEPYRDPDCGCRVITTFEGVFTNQNTIAGTYTTRGAGFLHVPASGQWKVTRQASHASTPED